MMLFYMTQCLFLFQQAYSSRIRCYFMGADIFIKIWYLCFLVLTFRLLSLSLHLDCILLWKSIITFWHILLLLWSRMECQSLVSRQSHAIAEEIYNDYLPLSACPAMFKTFSYRFVGFEYFVLNMHCKNWFKVVGKMMYMAHEFRVLYSIEKYFIEACNMWLACFMYYCNIQLFQFCIQNLHLT